MSKSLAAIGVVLMITGAALFFHSLGSGGGYFPAAMVIFGAVFVLIAILKSILKAWR